MRIEDAVNIEDLHQMAKRKLPRIMFDYIEGGVEDERGLVRNGAAAGGLPGVKKAIDIFVNEIDLVMGQIGCPSLSELGPDFLWTDDWPKNR